ncbi:MAG TPA: sugar ABC transporter permease [Chloroflexota bacterium]|nr:sugar ABC transporter permease [Chloroflexota bacterium]
MGRSAGIWPYVCLLPAVAFFAVFQLVPSLATSIFSLTDYTGLPHTPIHWVGLQNYTELLTGSRHFLVLSIQITAIFAVLVTVIQNGLAVLVAWLLNSRLRGQVTIRSLVFLPVVLGATINGLVWYVMFNPLSGPVTMLLATLGVKANLLGSTETALYAVIFVQIWANLGFSMMIFLAGMQGIPVEVYEAGVIDGTSPWAAFRDLTIPLLAPSITINVLLAVIGSMTTYELIFVLPDGGPAFSSQTLGMYVFNQAFYGGNTLPGFAAAIAMVQFALVFVVVLGMQYYLRQREAVL